MTTNLASASSHNIRGVVAAAIGNVLEWYDWTIYASVAIFFAQSVFQAKNTTSALLEAFIIFAIGFAIRPLGGWLIGAYCDKYGRRNGLSLTIVLMGVGSFIIAFTPTYAAIGIGAPLILTIGRLVQGVSYGGEVGSASAYIVEIAPDKRRGLYSSMFHFSVGIGLLSGYALMAVLTEILNKREMAEFGWRIPFLIGGLAAFVGLWIRRHIPETDPFMSTLERGVRTKTPLRDMVREYPAAAFKVCGVALAGTLSFYLFVVYLPTYAIHHYQVVPADAFLVGTLALVLYVAMQPLCGWLSDRVGRKALLLTYSIGTMVTVVPLMLFLDGTLWRLFIVAFVGVGLFAMLASVTPVVMAEQFPTKVRTVGIGVPYAIIVAIFGGTAPYLLTWLSSRGLEIVFFGYVAIAALVSTVAFLMMKDRTGLPLE